MKMLDNLQQWIAWKLPRKIVYFAYIRLLAYATTGQYGSTVVPELTAMDALKRWEEREQIIKTK